MSGEVFVAVASGWGDWYRGSSAKHAGGQFMEQVEALEVSGAQVALTHVTGGVISGVDSACAVHILSNR